MRLHPCDIVMVRGDSFLSRSILRLTRTKGEEPTEISHVGIVDREGDFLDAEILEAVGKVRRTTLRESYLGTGSAVSIARPTNLTGDQRIAILGAVRAYEGAAYGWGKIALHAIDAIVFRGRFVTRKVGNDRWPICSWLVAYGYQNAGLDFSVPVGAATPDDIWDFTVRQGSKYTWPLGRGELLPMADLVTVREALEDAEREPIRAAA